MRKNSVFKKSITVGCIVGLVIATMVSADAGEKSNVSAVGMNNFEKIEDYVNFKDVPTNSWYYNDVKKSYEFGFVNGYTDNTFKPEQNISVAEMISIISRINNIYSENGIVFDNKDTLGSWYQVYVNYVETSGIADTGKFSDFEKKATREEAAYLIKNAIPEKELSELNNITSIPDIDNSNQYSKDIIALYNAGILTGSDRYGNFNPKSNVTRAEISAMINRLVGVGGRKSFALEPIPVVQPQPPIQKPVDLDQKVAGQVRTKAEAAKALKDAILNVSESSYAIVTEGMSEEEIKDLNKWLDLAKTDPYSSPTLAYLLSGYEMGDRILIGVVFDWADNGGDDAVDSMIMH